MPQEDEVRMLNRLKEHEKSWEVKDRHVGLVFKHHVRRIEYALREADEALLLGLHIFW